VTVLPAAFDPGVLELSNNMDASFISKNNVW
jgi:hypothetical protein